MNANSRAFPVGIAASEFAPEYLQEGMSLRDYFAAKAMQTYALNGSLSYESIANRAYILAGEMMKVREI